MVGFPCKECQDRKVGCHDHCAKYLEVKKQKEDAKKVKLDFKHKEDEYYGFLRVTKRVRKQNRD